MRTDRRYIRLACLTITLLIVSCTKSYFKEFGEIGNSPNVPIRVQKAPFEFSIDMEVAGSYTSTKPLPDSLYTPNIVVHVPNVSDEIANTYLASFAFDRMKIAHFEVNMGSTSFPSDHYPMKCLLGPCRGFAFEHATIGDQVDSVSVTAFYQYLTGPGETVKDSVKATLYRIEGHFKTEIWLD